MEKRHNPTAVATWGSSSFFLCASELHGGVNNGGHVVVLEWQQIRNEKSGRTGGERGGKGREAAPTIVAWPLAIVAE